MRASSNRRGIISGWLMTLWLCGSVVGCASQGRATTNGQAATATVPPTVTATPTSGCGTGPLSAPGTSRDITIPARPASAKGSTTRMFRVHTPADYRAGQRYPVVLAFHGHGGNAAGTEDATGLSAFADQHGIIVAYPQGLLDADGIPFWASAGPIDFAIDDVAFTNAVLDHVQAGYCVDTTRLYVTGFSNGGGMANWLACNLAGRIAAAAPIAGNYFFSSRCAPARPIAILEVHGVADSVVPYDGNGSGGGIWRLPAIPTWLQDWATRDGCTSGPTTVQHTTEVTEQHWTNCRGDATIIHYRMEHGGHEVPATVGGQPLVALLWQFFVAHPLGGTAG